MARRVSQPTDAGPAAGARLTAPGHDPFAEAWEEFVRALRRGQARNRDGGPRLSLSQWHLLGALGETDGLPVGRLAKTAGITSATVTRVLDGLERTGIVARERPQHDRRTVIVRLTAKGTRRMRRTQQHIAAQRHRLYEALEDDQRAHAEQLLRHLARIIDAL